MDFNDLPADAQLLHFNIEEKLAELLRNAGPIKRTDEAFDVLKERMIKAILAAQTQTVEDVGGIQVEHDPATRMVTFLVPRVAGWFQPEE